MADIQIHEPNVHVHVLTLWQPWASLLIGGYKVHETRSWPPPPHLGWIAIHAAKSEPAWVRRGFRLPPLRGRFERAAWRRLRKMGYKSYADLPRGAILGMAHVDAVYPTSGREPATVADALFGDWSPGRYAWHVDQVCRFRRPVPATGRQRLWMWRMDPVSLQEWLEYLP